ncbi:oxidoreductase [Staphylococcus equorum]|uniref:NAD(P)-dependent oxidoreductase n=1 Tax=Staphylococcus equorum TaxID=246432 RepID=UPI000D1CEA89|nr:NAD(P)H-binding protein [Staphylococcus equorum]PTE43623.1 oxidoreductase [Staphylococcus equorum]PTE84592.1 oxidoreductase [Staphylococcus equorum]PTF12536.1 oxidoreductase [Staphylococcus equorum]
MKITVFGANGEIGKNLVEIALKNENQVNAFVRREGTLDLKHPSLNIHIGNTTDKEKLTEAIQGQDVVISAMGPALKRDKDTTNLPIRDAHKVIMEVMETEKVNRFITLGTTAMKAKEDKKQLITILPPIMSGIMFPKGKAEMVGINSLMNQSRLDWTVIRILNPNVKTNGNGYEVTFGDEKGKMNVSKYNVALAMYDAITTSNWVHKMPIVFNK